MTADQFSEALEALNLNQTTAGHWLKIDRRSVHNYANGKQSIPEPVAKLLRLCVKMKLNPEDVK